MDWTAILNGAAGAGVLAIILKLIDVYSTRNKVKSEATDTIVDTMLEAMQFLRDERNDYIKRIEALEKNQSNNMAMIAELRTNSDERNKQIERLMTSNEELNEQNEALIAQVAALQAQITRDTLETRELRNDYANAQRQIIKLEDLVISAGEYIEVMKNAMQKAGVELPLNGELMDSILRLKAERAGRGKP